MKTRLEDMVKSILDKEFTANPEKGIALGSGLEAVRLC